MSHKMCSLNSGSSIVVGNKTTTNKQVEGMMSSFGIQLQWRKPKTNSCTGKERTFTCASVGYLIHIHECQTLLSGISLKFFSPLKEFPIPNFILSNRMRADREKKSGEFHSLVLQGLILLAYLEDWKLGHRHFVHRASKK